MTSTEWKVFDEWTEQLYVSMTNPNTIIKVHKLRITGTINCHRFPDFITHLDLRGAQVGDAPDDDEGFPVFLQLPSSLLFIAVGCDDSADRDLLSRYAINQVGLHTLHLFQLPQAKIINPYLRELMVNWTPHLSYNFGRQFPNLTRLDVGVHTVIVAAEAWRNWQLPPNLETLGVWCTFRPNAFAIFMSRMRWPASLTRLEITLGAALSVNRDYHYEIKWPPNMHTLRFTGSITDAARTLTQIPETVSTLELKLTSMGTDLTPALNIPEYIHTLRIHPSMFNKVFIQDDLSKMRYRQSTRRMIQWSGPINELLWKSLAIMEATRIEFVADPIEDARTASTIFDLTKHNNDGTLRTGEYVDEEADNQIRPSADWIKELSEPKQLHPSEPPQLHTWFTADTLREIQIDHMEWKRPNNGDVATSPWTRVR
jgi:hypothetical protein